MADTPSSVEQDSEGTKWGTVGRGLLIVIFLVVVVVVLVQFDQSELQAYIEENRDLTFLLSIGVTFLLSAAFVPITPLMIFLAALLGPVQSIIINTVGTTLSALLHYQIGKQIGDIVGFEKRKSSLPFNLSQLPVDSPLFMLLGRFMPGGPRGLSILCGAYRVSFFRYLWTTILTGLLGAVFNALGGIALINILRVRGSGR